MDSLNKEINFARAFYFLAVPLMMILLIILSQFESTKSLAILISEDGNILRNNEN